MIEDENDVTLEDKKHTDPDNERSVNDFNTELISGRAETSGIPKPPQNHPEVLHHTAGEEEEEYEKDAI